MDKKSTKKSKWIPISVEIPGLCVDVLFWDGSHQWVGWNEADKTEDPSFVGYFRDYDGKTHIHYLEDVTHWMDLPEPPSS